MFRISSSLTLLVLLAACVEPAEITSEPVKANLLSSVSQERLTGNTINMTVRAFEVSEKKNVRGQEVIGAVCDLVSDEVRARVLTPQKVILPTFKQRDTFENRGIPGSLSITCKAGSLTGSTLVTANEKQVATTTGAGIAGALITLAVTAAVASSTPWQFPIDAEVTLKE